MAGEKRGLACEAVVALALAQAKIATEGKTLHWNVRPEACSIDVDLTIGKDPQRPEVVFQIAYPASYLDSNRKFWRNLAELWEAKVRLPNPAHVISVQFGDGMKEDLVTLSEHAFDGFVHLSAAAGFSELLDWIVSESKALPTDRAAKLAAVTEAMGRAPGKVKTQFGTLQETLAKMLSTRTNRFHDLWSSERKRLRSRTRTSARTPADLDTHLRRGLAKLLLCENPLQLIEAARIGGQAPDSEALQLLGLVTKSISGARLKDPEATWVCRHIPTPLLLSLTKEVARDGRFGTIRAPLLHLDVVRATVNYLIRNWLQLRDPVFMFSALRLPWHSPNEYLRVLSQQQGIAFSKRPYVRPGCVWEMTLECLRFCDDRSQAFGQSGIIRELDAQKGKLRKVIETTARELGIADASWRSASTVSYGLRDWIYGADRGNFSISELELLRCAFLLASEVNARESPSAVSTEEIVARWAHNLFETKLASYREFRPLDMLVERTLSAAGLKFERINYHTTFWREVGLSRAASLNVRSGTTTLYRAKCLLINTQSMTDEGSSHKKKELMARGYALRYSYLSGEIRAKSVQLALVLDGRLRSTEIGLLRDTGWDHIFTPETIQGLAGVVTEQET